MRHTPHTAALRRCHTLSQALAHWQRLVALMEDVHRFALAAAEDQGALRIHTVMLGWDDSRG